MAKKQFVAKVPLSIKGEGDTAAMTIKQPGKLFSLEEAHGAMLVRDGEAEPWTREHEQAARAKRDADEKARKEAEARAAEEAAKAAALAAGSGGGTS